MQPYVKALRGWRDVTRDAVHEPLPTQFRIDLRAAIRSISAHMPRFLVIPTEDSVVRGMALAFRIWELFALTIVLQVGMLPLMARDFHRITLSAPLVNLLAGWPLIKFFGLRGAAITLVLNKLAGGIQHYIPVSRLLSGIPLGKIIWKPIVAASCMAAYLGLSAAQSSILAGISATLLYGLVLLFLGILASGGIREFKATLSYTWSGAAPARQEEIRS